MKSFSQWEIEEEVPANNAGNVALPPDVQADKGRKKKKLYDGRTREAKKFVERMLARRKKLEDYKNMK